MDKNVNTNKTTKKRNLESEKHKMINISPK